MWCKPESFFKTPSKDEQARREFETSQSFPEYMTSSTYYEC